MNVTDKSMFRHRGDEYRAPAAEHVNVDDAMCDAELASIAAAHAKLQNGNGSQPQRFCDCPELVIDGRRVPCPPGHDCDYVKARSALVGDAERLATERMGCRGGWAKEFNRQMDRLAYNAGLLR